MLVERRVGRGRVLLWTSSLDLDWTNLPLQAAFLPLVQRITSWLGGEAGLASTRFEGLVGEPMSVPLPDGAGDPTLSGPGGAELAFTLQPGAEPAVRFVPALPGAYSLSFDGAQPFAWVAVNVDPLESDVRVAEALAEVEARLKPELFERRAELGLWSVWLGLVLLGLQALYGRWLNRRIPHATP